MTFAEVEAIRAGPARQKNGPWVTDWNAMAIKTAIKQLSKWLPLSAEPTARSSMDGTVRTDTRDRPLVDVQPDYIDGEMEQQGEITPPADAHFISAEQIEAVTAGLIADKLEDEASQLDWLSSAVGEPVEAINKLTPAQAVQVLAIFEAN
jgi:recombination protein RecT